MLSVSFCLKVITLISFHCISYYTNDIDENVSSGAELVELLQMLFDVPERFCIVDGEADYTSAKLHTYLKISKYIFLE